MSDIPFRAGNATVTLGYHGKEPSWAWITAADAAKLLRAALKRQFPGVKFGVRTQSYSMGASLNVTWTDGPAVDEVRAVAGQYDAGRFDGSIDLAYSVTHWLLPDGSAVVAKNPGSRGSGGYDEGEASEKPHPDAVLVHFGTTSVYCQRSYSAAFLAEVQDFVFGPGLVGDDGRLLAKAKVVEGYGGAHYEDAANQRFAGHWLANHLMLQASRASAGRAGLGLREPEHNEDGAGCCTPEA